MKNVNFFAKAVSIYCICLLFATVTVHSATKDMTNGKWTIRFNDETRKSEFVKDGTTILQDVSVKFKHNASIIESSSYSDIKFSEENYSDATGECKRFIIEYKNTENSTYPTIQQCFYLYPDKDYFLTDVFLLSSGTSKIESNYIAPIYTETQNRFLPQDANNRFLFVPFDNDGFITYGSLPLSRGIDPTSLGVGRYARDTISFEVTSIFNGETQEGLVIGSVEHDTWKSAIRMTGSPLSQAYINKLECYSGATHSITRDATDNNWLQPHGAVKGTKIKSARMLVGLFDDWRTGMETFGDVNALIAPKREWNNPTPFGWNSWGGMERNINFDGVISVSDFIKENIQGKGHFGEDGLVFVGLDSFWDNLNWEQLKQFADYCKANGQVPGIYWTPFCDWFPENDRALEGNNGYFYSQTHLKVNGTTKKLCGAGCMDPTAPSTLSRINFFIDKFKAAGFKYLKLDFMTNGIVEADSYYRDDITTGVQAYNFGMKHLRERCGDDMFIVESIAPLFPANYAHARRISCDAWGEMWHTNYMMNSLSFGWWLNRVYCFNDPDHLVMGDRSDAENMSRMTTGAVTGYCMLGDNLSTKGTYIGSATSQAKAKKYATYEKVNDVIRLGKSFRPAYGHKVFGDNRAVDLFYLETEDSYYIAYFNYNEGEKSGTLDLKKLNIDPDNIDTGKSFECWSSDPVTISEGMLEYSLPNNQAKLYHLFKKQNTQPKN